MTEDEKLLSPEASPQTMDLRQKQTRRLNNRPLVLGIAVVAFLLLVLGMVMVERGNKSKANIASLNIKPSTAYAKDLTSGAEGGVVNPPAEEKKQPEKEPPPPEPKPEEKKPDVPPDRPLVMDARTSPPLSPEAPRLIEAMKRARDKRWRHAEAAIEAPIKVQLEDVQPGRRGINDEIAQVERQLAALGNNADASYAQRLAAIKAATEGGSGDVDYSRRGDLSRMNQFGGATDWTNPAGVEAPSTMHIIRTGSVIPATLISGMNSDLPGQIVGQVAQDVYDTPTGRHLLIPQGSRLVGEYSSQVQYGQSRVFAVWQRIIFPDGKALDLGAMPGSSGAGYAGFKDRVNNHYFRIFGSAIMMSAILAGVEITQDDNNAAGNAQRMSDALSEALGNQLGGVMAEMLQKNMNIAPTLEIRPGYRFNVMLVKDLIFTGPYSGFDYVRR